MKLTTHAGMHQVGLSAKWLGLCLLGLAFAWLAVAQGVTTTTVQGTVFLANGHPGAGSLHISWPSFTTASNQAIAAGSVNVTIGADGFVSVNLAPNLGAMPAGLFYTAVYNMSDGSENTEYWPGDALLLNAPSTSLDAQVVVRSVKVSYRASYPDFVEYSVQFANDWADDLAIKSSTTIPADAWLPAPIAPTVLANLNNLTVTALTGTTVSINTGLTPPPGGGFEIRRRDFAFMPGSDPGLVARAAVPSITFARESTADRFYIRMYDGATPPHYSEFSTAIFINLPLG